MPKMIQPVSHIGETLTCCETGKQFIGAADERYTVTLEYCGHSAPRWVARFCGIWVGQDKYKSGALMLCIAHAGERERTQS